MLLHHLLPMLRDADAAGQLRARFTVMPSVNPLGMQQLLLRHHIGRYDPATGINHNRRWPDLFAVARRAHRPLSATTRGSTSPLIRKAVAPWIDAQQPRTAAAAAAAAHPARVPRRRLRARPPLRQRLPALHLHLARLMPELQDLSDWMGAAATLTAADSGGGSFDEVLPQLYRKVAAANPGKPVPLPARPRRSNIAARPTSPTTIGSDDARRLWGFLCERGLIDADPGPRPPTANPATPFEATEIVRVDRPGPRRLSRRARRARDARASRSPTSSRSMAPRPSSAARRSSPAPTASC